MTILFVCSSPKTVKTMEPTDVNLHVVSHDMRLKDSLLQVFLQSSQRYTKKSGVLNIAKLFQVADSIYPVSKG